MSSASSASASFRFLHTSDWQLGMPAHFLGEESRIRFAEARLAAVERIFSLAEEQGCQAIVVAGDVFDDNLLQPEVYRRALDVLGRAPVPVFLLPGNHDPFDAASVYRKADFSTLEQPRDGGAPVRVLADNELVPVPASTRSTGVGERAETHEQVSAYIVGAPLLTKKPSADLVAQACHAVADKYGPAGAGEMRVLVGHGNVDTFGDAFDLSAIDVDAAGRACRERIVDYVALGDTHSTVQLNDDGTVWYSGAHEVTDFLEPNGGGENHSGYALVIDISVDMEDASAPADVSVTEHRIGQWHFQALSAVINTMEDAEEFIGRLDAVEDKRHTVIKYALQGTVDLSTSAWLDTQLEERAPGFARLYERLRLSDLHVAPGLDELADMNVGGGFMQAAAEELADKARAEDSAASDALRLLFRLNNNVAKEA